MSTARVDFNKLQTIFTELQKQDAEVARLQAKCLKLCADHKETRQVIVAEINKLLQPNPNLAYKIQTCQSQITKFIEERKNFDNLVAEIQSVSDAVQTQMADLESIEVKEFEK